MESDMVNFIWLDSIIGVIKRYFQKELPQFTLVQEISHGPFWSIEFNSGIITIQIGGDIGFNTSICIEDSKFDLWQYDRSVNEKMQTSGENILYQLNILKQFLKEVS